MVKACSIAELQEAVRTHPRLRLSGSDTKSAFRLPGEDAADLRIAVSGIIEHHVDDQVVAVGAGTPVAELQAALREKGQCLPLPSHPLLAGFPGTVGGSLSMTLPHALQAQCGSWRDWVLGMTLVRADGTVAKTGSKAVKNVAGYDVHKLVIGARGTLGVVAEVILRTFPLKSLPPTEGIVHREPGKTLKVQRTRRSDYGAARTGAAGLVAEDPASSTLWLEEAERQPHDWVLGLNPPTIEIDETHRRLMERAKCILDPDRRLNPGEFGFL